MARAEEAAAPPVQQAPAAAAVPVPVPDSGGVSPAAPEMPQGVQDGISLAGQLLRMVAFLGGICALGWLAVRVLGPRLSPMNARPGDLIRVVDMKRIDPKTTLYVVEVAGKHALIGVTPTDVRALSHVELDEESIREVAGKRDGSTTQKVPFGQVLARTGAAKESVA